MEEDNLLKDIQEQNSLHDREDIFFDYLGMNNRISQGGNELIFGLADQGFMNPSLFDDTFSNKSLDLFSNKAHQVIPDKKIFGTDIFGQNLPMGANMNNIFPEPKKYGCISNNNGNVNNNLNNNHMNLNMINKRKRQKETIEEDQNINQTQSKKQIKNSSRMTKKKYNFVEQQLAVINSIQTFQTSAQNSNNINNNSQLITPNIIISNNNSINIPIHNSTSNNNNIINANEINQDEKEDSNTININTPVPHSQEDNGGPLTSLKPNFISNNINSKNNNISSDDNLNNQNPPLTDSKKREEKLIKNKISARKSRQKKKKYIESLEDLVKKYQNEIGALKAEKSYSFDSAFSDLDKEEKNILSDGWKSLDISKKNDYVNNQKKILENIFKKQIKMMMPIECKMFENKFIKLNAINEEDGIEDNLNKVRINIDLLNELYDFSTRDDKELKDLKGKEAIAYKLLKYYENMVDFIHSFKSCIKMI